MTLTFACGHRTAFDERRGAVCVLCGNPRVTAVSGDVPRITGTASGPHVTTAALPAMRVDLAPGGILPLKEPDHG